MTTFGPAYCPQRDGVRIATQMQRVRDYMLSVGWRTMAWALIEAVCEVLDVEAKKRRAG